MPRYIVKMQEHYLEWSTITDSPVTFGMTLEEFLEYYGQVYGTSGLAELSKRLERVDQFGTSAFEGRSVDDIVRGNRAGPLESRLSREDIHRAYCLREPILDGWLVPTVDEMTHE